MCQSNKNDLRAIYDALLDAFGPQHWWPAKTVDEIVIGAILAQNTAWPNVEMAIERLRQAKALSLDAIHQMDRDELAELIKPSGTFRIKAERLQGLTAWLAEHFDGQIEKLFALGIEKVRPMLLSVNGIGPETADAILLYAGGLPTFVIDAYTQRILRRHGHGDAAKSYTTAKQLFESTLPPDVDMFNQYHALLVELGKRYCRPTAQCEGCPLGFFPHTESL